MADMQIVPAGKNVEPQYVEMKVPLYSYGCEKKVKKALAKLKGIYSVNVEYSRQKVTVWGICNKYDVLATIKNKRKDARFWDLEDNIKVDEIQQNEEENDKANFTSNIRGAVLTKAKSFSFRALRKVFTRTHSF